MQRSALVGDKVARRSICRSGLQRFKDMLGHKHLEHVRGYTEVLLRGGLEGWLHGWV